MHFYQVCEEFPYSESLKLPLILLIYVKQSLNLLANWTNSSLWGLFLNLRPNITDTINFYIQIKNFWCQRTPNQNEELNQLRLAK